MFCKGHFLWCAYPWTTKRMNFESDHWCQNYKATQESDSKIFSIKEAVVDWEIRLGKLQEIEWQNYSEGWPCHLWVGGDILPKKQIKHFSKLTVYTGTVILTAFLLTSVFEVAQYENKKCSHLNLHNARVKEDALHTTGPVYSWGLKVLLIY